MQEILSAFDIQAPLRSQEQLSGGRIHGTYRLHTDSGDYIAQKLHPTAFPDTQTLMQRVVSVTDYLQSQFPETPTLHFYRTADGGYLYDGWRVMDCIPGETRTVPDSETIRTAGLAFGRFQAMLCKFPTPANCAFFHDPNTRFAALDAAISSDSCGRLAAAKEVCTRVNALRDHAISLQQSGLPCRIVHNDTKLTNLLFDPAHVHPPVVIDLDTVGIGYAAYDFGDAVRSLHGSAEQMNPAIVSAFSAGFLEGAAHLTPDERDSLLPGAVSITAELAARYLTDYLTGDAYFRHPNSLARAAQLTALAESLANQKLLP